MTTALNSRWAFVDESGDPHLSLDKEGTSQFYVVCAVLSDSTSVSELQQRLNEVRLSHFGPGEMKSSSIGNDLPRRKKVLDSLIAAAPKFCAIIVDKKEVDASSGLQWKKSFIKYVHRRLYARLFRVMNSLSIHADQHGSEEFKTTFHRYLRDRFSGLLLERLDFQFVDSADSVGVQAADVIAGTLRRVYSGDDPLELLATLKQSAVIIERWPPNVATPDILVGVDPNEKFDHLVAEQGIRLAREYILTHEVSEDPDDEARVEALRYLLYRYEMDETAYVERAVILQHVNQGREEEMSLQNFSAKVIGRLRSEGVLIASSNQGCKIPNATADMREFVSLVDGQVIPYLRRLSEARKQLQLASLGEYDIVQASDFPQLLKCLDCLKD
jgi:hypothetical protein